MNRIALLICVSVFLVVGCKHFTEGSSSDNGPRLKAMLKRTDVVLVKHFYVERSEVEDSDPKYPDIMPGEISFEPAWVYEPGKQNSGLKGAIVTVRESYFFSDGVEHGGAKGEATLDLDELRDLENALIAIQRSDAPWRNVPAGEDVEMQFSAKDDFRVSAFHLDQKGDVLYASAGNASVSINFQKSADLASAIQSVISLLESKQ